MRFTFAAENQRIPLTVLPAPQCDFSRSFTLFHEKLTGIWRAGKKYTIMCPVSPGYSINAMRGCLTMKAHFKESLRTDKLREFIQRRRINTIGVFILTLFSLVLTILGALVSFPRTYILAFVTVMLVLLSAVQIIKLRSGFRTIRDFHGYRRRRKHVGREQAE